MDVSVAAKILDAAISLDGGINAINALLSEIDDPEERAAWKKQLGKVMFAIFFELVVPIERDFVELRREG